jgi:hypothetical protein
MLNQDFDANNGATTNNGATSSSVNAGALPQENSSRRQMDMPVQEDSQKKRNAPPVSSSFMLKAMSTLQSSPKLTAVLMVAGLAAIAVGSMSLVGLMALPFAAAVTFLCAGATAFILGAGFFAASKSLATDKTNQEPLDKRYYRGFCS